MNASVAGGVIVRDAETRRDIRRTAAVSLPTDSADTLSLVVTKSRYRLDVFRGGDHLKTYPVALGFEPAGRKMAQGDGRTPEGEYTLIPHHPSPAFGECFYICYPNEDDADRGLGEGLLDREQKERILACLQEGRIPPHETRLGGLILLHGTKDRAAQGLTSTNWTLGCIAMENRNLLELLGLYRRSDRPTLTILP